MESLNKTGHEYYSKMPKSIRKRWSNNFKEYSKTIDRVTESEFLGKTFNGHKAFIVSSFRWKDTKEGIEYWEEILNENYDKANKIIAPKTSINGTITFIALLFLLLGFYALIWSAFFRKDSPIRKATNQKFIEVTVWEKPDTMDMIYANKNYKTDD